MRVVMCVCIASGVLYTFFRFLVWFLHSREETASCSAWFEKTFGFVPCTTGVVVIPSAGRASETRRHHGIRLLTRHPAFGMRQPSDATRAHDVRSCLMRFGHPDLRRGKNAQTAHANVFSGVGATLGGNIRNALAAENLFDWFCGARGGGGGVDGGELHLEKWPRTFTSVEKYPTNTENRRNIVQQKS